MLGTVPRTSTADVPAILIDGHAFDLLTQICDCGMTMARLHDATRRKPAPSHDDMLNPGTVEKTYRQRSTGRAIKYRVRK